MTDHPTNPEPLPDPETPLTDLVDEEVLGQDDSAPAEPPAPPAPSAEEAAGAPPVGTRRVSPDTPPEEDTPGDDAPPDPDDPAESGPTRRATADDVRQEQPVLIQQPQERLTVVPLALSLIAAGLLLLAQRFETGIVLGTGAALILVLGGLVLTHVFRFFRSGRRERGLFFIAMVLTVWGLLLAMHVTSGGRFSLPRFWPLLVAAVGVAFVFTFLFERTHQAGLLFPGILLILASAVAILVLEGFIGEPVQRAVRDYWPLLVAFLGLLLIPTALQKQR